MARVNFPGQNVVSGWLPVLVSFAGGNFTEAHVDAGTHVACLMAGEGCEQGVILGAFYDDTNKPGTGDEDVALMVFADGGYVRYDRKKHVMTLNSAGDIVIMAAGNVIVEGSRIDLN